MSRLLAASVAILLFSTVAPFAPAAAASDSQVVTSTQSANPLLLSVDVGQGSLQRKSNGLFTLTAQADSVVWFTDRPGRAAGVMTAQAFVRKWAQYGFRTSPPNAALIADGRTEVLELTRPRIDGKNLVFTARPIPLASVSRGIEHHAKRAQKPIAREFEHGSLFIDDAADCTAGESAAVSAAINAVVTGVAGAINAVNDDVNNMLENGMTPTQEFEMAYTRMTSELSAVSVLAQDPDVNSLSQVADTLTAAAAGASMAINSWGAQMAQWELAALAQAVSTLRSTAGAAYQAAVAEVQQVSQCESNASPATNTQS